MNMKVEILLLYTVSKICISIHCLNNLLFCSNYSPVCQGLQAGKILWDYTGIKQTDQEIKTLPQRSQPNMLIYEDWIPQPEEEPFIFNTVMKTGSIFHLASHKEFSFLPLSHPHHMQLEKFSYCSASRHSGNAYRLLSSKQTSALLLQPPATAASPTHRPLALPMAHKCANPVRCSSTSTCLGVEQRGPTENGCIHSNFLRKTEPLALLWSFCFPRWVFKLRT